MNIVVLPFTHVFYTIIVLQLMCLHSLVIFSVLLRNLRIFVVWQTEVMVKSEIQLLQLWSHLVRYWLRDRNDLRFRRKTHFRECFFKDGRRRLFLANDGIMNSLFIHARTH